MLSRLAVGAVAVLILVAAADALRGRGASVPPPAPAPAVELVTPPSVSGRSVVTLVPCGPYSADGPGQVNLDAPVCTVAGDLVSSGRERRARARRAGDSRGTRVSGRDTRTDR